MLVDYIPSRILSCVVFDFTVLIALLYTKKEPEAFAFLKVYVESVLPSIFYPIYAIIFYCFSSPLMFCLQLYPAYRPLIHYRI